MQRQYTNLPPGQMTAKELERKIQSEQTPDFFAFFAKEGLPFSQLRYASGIQLECVTRMAPGKQQPFLWKVDFTYTERGQEIVHAEFEVGSFRQITEISSLLVLDDAAGVIQSWHKDVHGWRCSSSVLGNIADQEPAPVPVVSPEPMVHWSSSRSRFICSCWKKDQPPWCEHVDKYVKDRRDAYTLLRCRNRKQERMWVKYPYARGLVDIEMSVAKWTEEKLYGTDGDQVFLRLFFNEDLYLWLDEGQGSAAPLIEQIDDTVVNSTVHHDIQTAVWDVGNPNRMLRGLPCKDRGHGMKEQRKFREMVNEANALSAKASTLALESIAKANAFTYVFKNGSCLFCYDRKRNYDPKKDVPTI